MCGKAEETVSDEGPLILLNKHTLLVQHLLLPLLLLLCKHVFLFKQVMLNHISYFTTICSPSLYRFETPKLSQSPSLLRSQQVVKILLLRVSSPQNKASGRPMGGQRRTLAPLLAPGRMGQIPGGPNA